MSIIRGLYGIMQLFKAGIDHIELDVVMKDEGPDLSLRI